jgi:DNA mismatch repair protein MutS
MSRGNCFPAAAPSLGLATCFVSPSAIPSSSPSAGTPVFVPDFSRCLQPARRPRPPSLGQPPPAAFPFLCCKASPGRASGTGAARPAARPRASAASVTTLTSAEVDVSLLTPMMAHWVETKRAHAQYLILYRVGDFFETFFEDAALFSSLCDIALTAKDAGKALGARVPMSGIPHYTLDDKCRILLSHSVNVAVVDQVEAASAAMPGALVKRAVTRLITPGTLVDDALLDTSKSNYLASVSVLSWRTTSLRFGVALADVCTGEMRATDGEGLEALEAILRAAQPAEVLVPAGQGGSLVLDAPVRTGQAPSAALAKFADLVEAIRRAGVAVVTGRPVAEYAPIECNDMLCVRYNVDNVESLGCRGRDEIVSALGSLLSFVSETVEVDGRGSVPFCHPTLFSPNDCLYMDETAMRNLEVVETLRAGPSGKSLRWAVDRTATAMGARRVRSWLLAPLKDVDEILYRQRIVVRLAGDLELRECLRLHLRGFPDLERLVGRVSGDRASPRELQRLAQALVKLPDIGSLLSAGDSHGSASEFVFHRIVLALGFGRGVASDGGPSNGERLVELGMAILDALVDPAPATLASGHALSHGGSTAGVSDGFLGGGHMFRSGYSEELDSLLGSGSDPGRWMAALEKSEQERTRISSLRIKKLRNSGYAIRIARSAAERMLELDPSYFADLGYERTLSTKTEMRFKSAALEKREREEDAVLGAVLRLEGELFKGLVSRVGTLSSSVREAACGIAALDALLGFACVSSERGYVPPLIERAPSRALHIIDGRHPVVEQNLPPSRTYVPNSFCVGIEATDSVAAEVMALHGVSDSPFCDEMILCGPNAS